MSLFRRPSRRSKGRTSRKPRRPSRPLWLEALEDRRVLSVVTITRDSPYDLAEADPKTMVFKVWRTADGTLYQPLTVNLSYSGSATRGVDYTEAPLSVEIPAGIQSTGVPIDPLEDDTIEGTETIVAHVAPGGYTIGDPSSASVNLLDDEAHLLKLSIDDVTDLESAGNFLFTVTLSAPSHLPVSVSYATADGTAVAGQDYTSVNGTLNFSAGETTKTVSVPILEDSIDEPAEEFYVNLSNPMNALIADGQGIGTIIDNEGLPELAINDITGWEDAGEFVFTVFLSPAADTQVSVDVDTFDGSALDVEDYLSNSQTLVFPIGTTEQTFTVPIVDDRIHEETEEFYAFLSNPVGAGIQKGVGVGTIKDNDREDGPIIECICVCVCTGAETTENKAEGSAKTKSASGAEHRSGTNPHPVVTVDTTLSDKAPTAESIEVQLIFGGIAGTPVFYSPAGLEAGQTVRFALQGDATTLATGRYPWEMVISEHYTDNTSFSREMTGFEIIRNLSASEFGHRWQYRPLDRLYLQDDGALLVGGDGNSFWFGEQPDGSYGQPAGAALVGLAGLVKNPDASFTLTYRDKSVSEFDSTGLLTEKRDRNGNAAAFDYIDGDGDTVADELSTWTDFAGGVTTLVYAAGLISTITDFAGRVTSFSHDVNRHVTSITEPDPDGPSNPLLSPVTSFAYDPATELIVEVTDTASDVTAFEYDHTRALATITNPNLSTRQFAATLPMAVVDTSSGVGTEANPAPLFYPGEAIGSETNELGHTSTWTTGRFGFLTSFTNALGHTTIFDRTSEGLPVRVVEPDPDGVGVQPAPETLYEHDPATGNLLEMTLPDGSTRQWTYEPVFNQVTSYTDEMGRRTLFNIDPANGNVLAVRQVVGLVDDPVNGETDDLVTSFTYTTAPAQSGDPPAGLVATLTDPMGRVTDYDRNARGLVTQVTFAVGTPAQASIGFEYSSADNITAWIDELGNRTEASWDDLDRMTELVLSDPDGAGPLEAPAWAFEYSIMSQLVSEIDPLGRETLYTHGDFGKLVKISREDHDGNGQRTDTTFGRDVMGQVTSIVGPTGRTTQLTLDELGRTETVTFQDPDGAGELQSPVIQLVFDALNRVVREIDPAGFATDWEFLEFGKRVRETGPDADGAGLWAGL